MAVIDIVILAVIGLFVVLGAIRGIIREIADLAGLLTGAILALKFSLPVGAALPPDSWPLMVRVPIAAILIMVVGIVVVKIIAYLIRKIFVHGALKTIDRIWGALFGLVKGLILVIIFIVLVVISPLSDDAEGWAKNAPVFRTGMKMLEPIVSGFKDDFIEKSSKRIEEMLPISLPELKPVAKKDIADFFGKVGEDESSENIRDAVRKLSPDSRRYLEVICEMLTEVGDKGKAAAQSIPPAVKKITKNMPLEKIKEELRLSQQ